MRHLLSVDDLDEGGIDAILQRARRLRLEAPQGGRSFLCGLLFTAPSLRTRVGFAAAAHRLGGAHVDVFEQRFATNMSAPESFEDTLRTLCGMVDIVVVRLADEASEEVIRRTATCPVINGGSSTAHPTQALIDLAALEEIGPVAGLRIGLCGDLTQRSALSLLRLLSRRPPASLHLMAPPERDVDLARVAPDLVPLTRRGPSDDLSDLDVLYLVGFPPRGPSPVTDEVRRRYVLTAERAATLPVSATVLCPLPVVDEVDPLVRADPRIGWWAQSDRGLFIRMAVLEQVLHKDR